MVGSGSNHEGYLPDRPVGHSRIRLFFFGGTKNFGLKAAINKHDNIGPSRRAVARICISGRTVKVPVQYEKK
jgi:hypothetical protein